MGGDDGFMARVTDGAIMGVGIGSVAGTFATFWNSAGTSVNRAKFAQQVLPTISANVGYMAAVGIAFKGGESIMEGITGKEDWVNSAFAGACAGAVMGFRSGSIPAMAATAGCCAFGCAAVHLNGDKFT